MFKAMLKYRLTAIWRDLIIAFLIVEAFMIITEIILSIKLADFSVLSSTLGISLAAGGLIVTQADLIILSFTTARKPFDFGILNGISRKTSYITQLVSLFGSQLVTFVIFYPIMGILFNSRYSGTTNLLDPKMIIVIILGIWSIMAGAIAISSFVTLFERKIWWVVLGAWLVVSKLFEAYIQPVIVNLLPGWQNYYNDFSGMGSIDELDFGQPYLWLIVLVSIVIPLVFAGVCQYFMQTKRLTLSFKRNK